MGRNWTGRKHRCMEKKTITIITPWLNSPELIPTYIASVKGADVIIIDNGSGEHYANIDPATLREWLADWSDVEVLHDRAHGDVYAHAVKGS